MQPRHASSQPAQHTASRPAHPAHAPMPPLVSGRWLLAGLGATLVLAALCAWGALCLLFWQGNWQLLYHPAAAVTRTPASVGLAFTPVSFAPDDAGQPRLTGWWLPAGASARFTVLYLHGQNGNLGDTLDALATLHASGVNVLAFDYRGYGQSQFARPSEAHWRNDVDWALTYLTGTRHLSPRSIVLYGDALGANLALEAAAQHSDLAGVVAQQPVPDPVAAIFSDPRAHLVPAHLLARDRYDLNAAAARLRIPSLWLIQPSPAAPSQQAQIPPAYRRVTAPKSLVLLPAPPDAATARRTALTAWLSTLSAPPA